MTLLDRYFIKQILVIGLFAILVFTISWLAPETMFKAIQGVAQHKLTVEQACAYLLYQAPMVLGYCLPISALFASVFFFRQLSLSSELISILASGVSFRRLLVPAGVAGLAFSLLFFATQESLVPWATQQLRNLNEQTHFDSETIAAPQVTYVEKSPTGTMEKFLVISPTAKEKQNQFIFLFYEGKGDDTRIRKIVTATHGNWNMRYNLWELKDGIEYFLDPDGIYRQVKRFDLLKVKTSPIAQALLTFPTGNPSEFRVKDLERYVRLLTNGGQTEDARFYGVRLYQRYFLPTIPFFFALLGTGIGMERSRMRRNLGLTYAAVLLLFYNIMVPVSTTLGSIGLLPTPIAAVLPVLLAIIAGMGIIKLREAEG